MSRCPNPPAADPVTSTFWPTYLLQVLTAHQAIGRGARGARGSRGTGARRAGRASRSFRAWTRRTASHRSGRRDVRQDEPAGLGARTGCCCAGRGAAAAPPAESLAACRQPSGSSTATARRAFAGVCGVCGVDPVPAAGGCWHHTNRERSAQHRPEHQLTLHAKPPRRLLFRESGAERMAAPGTAPERCVMVGANSDAASPGGALTVPEGIWLSGTRAMFGIPGGWRREVTRRELNDRIRIRRGAGAATYADARLQRVHEVQRVRFKGFEERCRKRGGVQVELIVQKFTFKPEGDSRAPNLNS